MAITLTDQWQTIAEQSNSFTYGSSTLTFTLYLLAYYERIDANSGRIHYKLSLRNNSSLNWTSNNQWFYCYCDEEGTDAVQDPHGYIYANEFYDVWTSDGAGKNVTTTPESTHHLSASYDVVVVSGENWYLDEDVITPAEYTQPTASTPVITPGAESITASVNVTSWGNPSNASGRKVQLTVFDLSNVNARFNAVADSQPGTIVVTVDNNSSQLGTLVIQSNTRYRASIDVNNTKRSKSFTVSSVTTKPASPVASNFAIIDPTSASFDLTESSAGTVFSIKLQYRIAASGSSYGDWVNVGSAGNKQTESVIVTGLDSNTEYNVQVRAATTYSEYSEVTTYTNAFKTTAVTTTITSQSDIYDGSVKRIINLALSAVSTSGTSYEVSYSYKKASDANWTTNVITSSSNTPTITLSNLDQYTTYNFKVKSRIAGGIDETWGTEVETTFTTPSYNPGSPVITYEFSEGRKQFSVSVLAGQGSASVIRLDGSIKKDNTTIWSGSFTADRGEISNLPLPNPSEYSTIEISFTQTIEGGIVSNPTVVTFPVPYKILGYVIEGDGTKKAIVGIKIKDKNGNINAGDYEHPFVIK